MGNEHSKVNLLGIEVSSVFKKQLITSITTDQLGDESGQRIFFYLNAHVANLARRDENFRRILNQSYITYADGMSVLWAGRLLGMNIPERMTGVDLILDVCRVCERQSISLYFLGGEKNVAYLAAEELKALFPKLEICGCRSGHFDHVESQSVIHEINAAAPQVLVVGMGSPRQEGWIMANKQWLRVKVIWAVGALFDYYSGKEKRGPDWMVHNGFEWLCRLWVDPCRRWQRYVVGNVQFVLGIVGFALTKK